MQARNRLEGDQPPGGCGACAFTAIGTVVVTFALVWYIFNDPLAMAELEATPFSFWSGMLVGVPTATALSAVMLYGIAYLVADVAQRLREARSVRSRHALDGSERTAPSKTRWFLVAFLSVGVLVTTGILWGSTTGGETSALGVWALGLVWVVCLFVAGTAMAQLFFAFLRDGGRKGPIKALILLASGWAALSIAMWEGTPEDVAGATMAAGIALSLFASPGVIMFVRARVKEDQRIRQDAERRKREAEEEAKRAKRERLKREREEERQREEARQAQAEWERAKHEQEERRREEAKRANEGRKRSRGSGNKRSRAGEERSTDDRGQRCSNPARPHTRSAHEILGVAPDASEEEIVVAYRKKVRMYHPDKVSGLAPEYTEIAEREMKEINAAYAELKPKKR